jgi:hypothetical protein
VNEGDIEGGPSQLHGPQIGTDQVRPKSSDSTARARYPEAEAYHSSLRRPGLDCAQFFDRFAGPGFLKLPVAENEQADDNRRWRSCCFRIGAHHIRSGRVSGWAELRHEGATLGDQAISAKIRLTEVSISNMTSGKKEANNLFPCHLNHWAGFCSPTANLMATMAQIIDPPGIKGSFSPLETDLCSICAKKFL